MDRKEERRPQWIYLVPVAGAPLAHIAVSLAKRHPTKWRSWAAVAGWLTVAAVASRMFLMADSGYPGQEAVNVDRYVDHRLLHVHSAHGMTEVDAGADTHSAAGVVVDGRLPPATHARGSEARETHALR